MDKIIRLLTVLGLVSLILVACATLEISGTTQPSPTPCVTATPSQLEAASATAVVAMPAGTSNPAGGEPGAPSLDELATREAQLSQQNRPVELHQEGQVNQPTLPVCPTPTPSE